MSGYSSESIMKFNIRAARDDDIEKMYRLDMSCFGIDGFNKRQLKHSINSKVAVSLVAELDGEFAGFIIGLTIRNRFGRYGRLYSLDVEPRFRRMGIATLLFDELDKRLREMGCNKCFLEVKTDNMLAIPLYEKLGFSSIRIIPNYYKDGLPALKMVKQL